MNIKETDLPTIFAKGLIGAIPFVGPLAAEIIGTIIPNQRFDRIESFLKILESKISEEDKEKIKERIAAPESVDIFEDSFIQASRALSEERKEYIASLLKNSLTDEQLFDIQQTQYKKLLSLLGQLNDIEVLILKSHSLHRGCEEYDKFWEEHGKALTAPRAYIGSPPEQHDKQAIFRTYRNRLVDLSLLRGNYKRPKKGEIPEFDEKTGRLKSQGTEITMLGGLLLRSIDLAE